MSWNVVDYGAIVLDHYENPRNVGEIEEADAVATVGNPACGDLMKLSLRVREGAVAEARFKTFGCGAAIAASSMTTVLIQGRKLQDLEKITNLSVAEALGGLPPSKVHCSVLAEEAIREALADYRRRAGLRGPVESSGAHAAIGARDKGEMGV
jgi:nitrogen fixation NifU-like protein